MNEKYIVVEITSRKFLLAKRIIGTEKTYTALAEFKSKHMAEAICKTLNGEQP